MDWLKNVMDWRRKELMWALFSSTRTIGEVNKAEKLVLRIVYQLYILHKQHQKCTKCVSKKTKMNRIKKYRLFTKLFFFWKENVRLETLLLFSNVELNYHHLINVKLFWFNILFCSLIEVFTLFWKFYFDLLCIHPFSDPNAII